MNFNTDDLQRLRDLLYRDGQIIGEAGKSGQIPPGIAKEQVQGCLMGMMILDKIIQAGGSAYGQQIEQVRILSREKGIPVREGSGSASYASPSSASSSDGCFIATAAYGSYQAPQVLELRAFRDEILLKSIWGRAIVKTYYKLSPPIATLVEKSEPLKAATRFVFLEHFVSLVRPLVKKGHDGKS